MKKRSTLYIFLSLLFSLVLIGTAFSTFVFPTADKLGEHDDDADGFIDDIDNNYTLDANAYTVYFFSSPGWAYYIKNTTRKEGQSMSDYLSVDNYLSYVKNDLSDSKYKSQFSGTSAITKSSLKKIGYFPDDEADDTGTYGYRIRYADTCISSATFEEVPKPTTTGRDSKKFKLLFIGWTGSLQSAISYGYDSQGEYNYVSAYDELSLLDNKDNDNIDEANKVVFLFPVFTAGKDYDSQKESVVRIHDRNTVVLRDDDGNPLAYDGTSTTLDASNLGVYFSNELYFSQTGSRNTGYYSYKNLNVRENAQYYLDFDFSYGSASQGGWSGVWYNFWDTKRTTFDGKWDGEHPNSSGTELKPLFDTTGKNKKEDHNCAVDEPGIYNIYVYVHNDGSSHTDTYTDSCEAFEKIQLSNTALVWYEDPKDSTQQVMTWAKGNGGAYKVYVKIEKIVEIGLAGGRTKSLEYEFSQQMNKSANIIPAEDTSSDSSTVVKEGLSSRYYITNNVFMEGTAINESISSFNSNTQGEYFYPSDLSMIVGNDDTPMPISQADSEKLKTFNDNYQKVYPNTLYDFTNSSVNKFSLKKNSDVIRADDKGDISSSNLPYDYTKLDSSSNYYIRTEKTGFYSIAARIDVETKRVSGSKTKTDGGTEEHRYCTVAFKSCEVALAYGQPIYANIYLYKKGDTIQTSDGKFINTSDSGNWYAKCVNTVEYGQPLTYDTEFEVRQGTGTSKKKLSELMTSGTTSYHLTNHLTGREFRFDSSNKSNPLRRSYAFYLMPGDWKEGEIPKNTTK